MKRPPFDSRIPVTLVIAGMSMVLLTLGAFSVSVRKMTHDPPRPDPMAASESPHSSFEERSADGFGWDLQISLESWQLQANLRDASGAPVSGGTGQMILTRHDQGQVIVLREAAPGLYVAEIPRHPRGELDARVRIENQEGHIAQGLLIAY